jgi:hypothetical protein
VSCLLTSLRLPAPYARQDVLNLGTFMCPIDVNISHLPLLHLPDRSTGRLLAEALGTVEYDKVAFQSDGMQQLAQRVHTARVELLASTCFQRVQEACQGGHARARARCHWSPLLMTACNVCC